jgi:CDGSH-type Zn-finger protein
MVRADGENSAADDTDSVTTVVPYPDGPLIIRGDFRLQNVDGAPIEQYGSAVALCRCGRSAVKPFCDGTHKRPDARQRPARQRRVVEQPG